MKQLGKHLFLVLVFASVVFFVGCDKDDNLSFTINFESVELPEIGYLGAENADGAHVIDGVSFLALYNSEYMFSSGVIISSLTDTITSGYTNSYSVYAGEGADKSINFAIINPPYGNTDPIILFEKPVNMESVAVTNSTYAALSMRDGDAFAKAFNSEDEDFFSVTLEGFDEAGESTGNVVVYLADFRNGSNTGILRTWKNVDLGALGTVNSIGVSFQSSDVGTYGINTPLNFAIDNLRFSE